MVFLSAADSKDLNAEQIKLPYTLRKPDILIGVDQYDLFEFKVLRRLPSGFYLLDSLIGPVIREGRISGACHYSYAQCMPALPYLTPPGKEATLKTAVGPVVFSLESAGLGDLNTKMRGRNPEEFKKSLRSSMAGTR
uniref:Uncharacterized protein n=1 Tax=Ditylenchus dipsaci TaxID=166011 RepID=A0A915CUP3_9BILA